MKKTLRFTVCALLIALLCVLPFTSSAAAETVSGGVTVTTCLNGKVLSETQIKKTIIISYNITSPMMLEDGQGVLNYDSSVLKLVSFKMPNITSSLIINKNIKDAAKFNFTGVNSETNSGLIDFKNGGVFAELEFEVVEGASGSTKVNFIVEELDALENNNEAEYFFRGEATYAGKSTFDSMLNPTIIPDKPGVKVSTLLNDTLISKTHTEKTITITYKLSAPLLIEDGQGTLNYDSSKLRLVSFTMPNITSSLMVNRSIDDIVKFNFTGVDSETNSGKVNFKDGGIFAQAEFEVIEDASGSTDVNLKIEELNALENNKEVEYISKGEVTENGGSIINSMKSPEISLEKPMVEKGVKVLTLLNDKLLSETQTENTITILYHLTAPMMIEDGQGTLTYDSSKLSLVDVKMPNITSSLTLNRRLDNMVKFNFTGVNSENGSGLCDFRNGGVFLQADFEVVEGATGLTNVNLALDELTAFENNKEVAYISKGEVTSSGTAVIDSMLSPSLILEEPDDEPGVTVYVSLNGDLVYKSQTEDSILVTYYLTSPMLIEDGQGSLNYDSSKLTLVDVKMPNITSSLTLNKNLENMVKFNFTGVDGEKQSGLNNFKNGGTFIQAEFKVVDGAKGSTKVNLELEELDALENGTEVEYFTKGTPTEAAKGIVLSSLKDAAVIIGDFSEGSSPSANEDPSSDEGGNDNDEPVIETNEPGTAETLPDETVSQDNTNSPQKQDTSDTQPKKSQKISANSYTKTNGCNKFSLNAKTSGDGALSYKTSKKSVATVSANGKVTVKGCGKAVITITAAETAKFKSAEKKITVKIKPAKVDMDNLKSKGNKITFKIEKQAGVTGYNIEASKKSSFKNAINGKLKGTKCTVAGVKKGNKYYVRIRAFVKIDGEKYYSKWARASIIVK